MKKNSLYTVTPWNQNVFCRGGNKYAFGDFLKKDSTNYMGNWLGANKLSAGTGSMIGALGTAVGGLGSSLIGGGYDAYGVGNSVSSIGNTIGSAVSTVNPLVGGIISAGSGIIGGGINRLWGMKTNQEALNKANSNITAMKNFTSNASTFDNVETPIAVGNVGTVYKGGVFKKGSARRKNAALQRDLDNAVDYAYNSVDNNIANLQSDQYNNLLASSFAFGGPIGLAPMTGALEIMQADKYINAINNRTNAIAKNNTAVNTSSSFSPLGNAFADGGGIHIKPSHKGLFTEKANRAGMGVQAYASHVLANKEDYPSSTVRQANFARNAAGWKHDIGGSLEGAFLDEFGKDPLGAVMRYNQGLEAMAAQREAEREAAAQQAAYDDLQKRVLAAETQNQGLQSMLDSQGLTIQALMEQQRQNNYADGWKERMGDAVDNTVSSTSSLVGNAADKNKNWQYIKKRLKASGKFNDTQIEGIKLNLQRESGFNWKDKSGDNGTAWGLAQWHEPRRPKDMSFDGQINHLIDTLYNYDGKNHWIGKDNYNGFMNARTPEEAHYFIAKGWERPASDILTGLKDASDRSLRKHAFGGELGTNGTDFTTGLLEINTGNSHEENPHEGVQLGFDEQGIPNLVEEGETVYNDYVFSNRLKVPAFMRRQLGLGGSMKDEITFAAASKKIAEAGKERPNNPMDMDYMDDALGKLAQVQEAERMRMHAEETNDEMERINALPMEGMMQGAMGIEAAYGGQLGNVFEGKGNKPQIVYRPNDKSFARRILGDNAVTDAIESAGKFVEDPLGTMFGDNIEAAMDWLANASEPAMNKFFATDFGQKVAQYIVDNENSSSKSPYVTEAGKNATIGKAAARAWGRAHKGVVNAAKKSIKNLADVRSTKKVKPQGNTLPVKAQSSAVTNTRPTSLATRAANTGLERQTGLVRQTGLGPANQTGLTTSSNTTFTPWTVGPLAEAAAIAAGITGANRMFGNSSGDALADGDPAKVFGNVFNSNNEVKNIGQDAVSPIVSGVNDPYTNWLIGQLPSDSTAPKNNDSGAITPPNENKPAAEAPLTIPTLSGYENWTPYQNGALEKSLGLPSVPTKKEVQEGASNIKLPQNNTREDDYKINPYPTWMRYAPAVGTGIMTLTDLLGLTNRPDYTYADKLEAAANRAGYAPSIRYTPIGDYMTYRPLDRLFYANQLQANARATDRALANTSGGNRGTAQAAMLANGYNTNNNLGNLYRQAEEYNLAQRERVADFNRKTNMFNSQMGLEADMANARYRQQAANAQLSGLAQAAAMRDAIDQRVGAARSANITNLLNNLGNIGRENFAMNQINYDRTRPYKGRLNGTSYYYNGNAFGGEIERNKKNKKQGRRSK